MAVFSSLRASFVNCRNAISTIRNGIGSKTCPGNAVVPIRGISLSAKRAGGGGHDRNMVIVPSSYNWQLFKDQFHLYIMLGIIPCSLLTLVVNIFVGPATLTEIPEGYEPKHWEYYKSPISRFLARYFFNHPQKVYEMNIHYMQEHEESRTMARLEKKVMKLMAQRGDYPALYQQPFYLSNLTRASKEEGDIIKLHYSAERD